MNNTAKKRIWKKGRVMEQKQFEVILFLVAVITGVLSLAWKPLVGIAVPCGLVLFILTVKNIYGAWKK